MYEDLEFPGGIKYYLHHVTMLEMMKLIGCVLFSLENANFNRGRAISTFL